ncbi:hypothetical protein H4R19_004257, partial [Coemansia spiralis]
MAAAALVGVRAIHSTARIADANRKNSSDGKDGKDKKNVPPGFDNFFNQPKKKWRSAEAANGTNGEPTGAK